MSELTVDSVMFISLSVLVAYVVLCPNNLHKGVNRVLLHSFSCEASLP
jgi:hypothetical protein